ncbi:MAG TPA: DNRLRE domain-containing protein [Bacteroidales bacterium]
MNFQETNYLSPLFANKMRYSRCCLIALVFVLGAFFNFTSCRKDSKCNCSADTIKIAKIFQPDGSNGKDAVIESIIPDQNNGGTSLFTLFAWTTNGEFDTARSLIEFNLSYIPPQTKIKKAELSLYWKPFGNLTDQTGENAFSIYRITQPWDEATVTWNNQPSTTDLYKVMVPKSTSIDQSYLNIDVTYLVQDMIDDPSTNYGFMLKLDTEFPYRLVVLASSNDSDKTKHPRLVIYY